MLITILKKGGKVQELLHQFKYKGRSEIGVKIGKVLAQDLLSESLQKDFDLIVPAPLHPSRRRRRGFNQCEEFAKGLALGLNIPYTEHFVKRNVSDVFIKKR